MHEHQSLDNVRFCDGRGAMQALVQQPLRSLVSRPGPVKVGASIVSFVLLLLGLIVGFGIGAAIFAGSQTPITVTRESTMMSITTIHPHDLLETCFSPGGNCVSRVVYWIGRANSSIHILIYSLTLNAIGDALVQAKERGIDVKIVWDKSNWNDSGSEYQKLKNSGIEVRIDYRHGLLHDKVAIIDQHIIITGSYNWSQAANQENQENLVVIDSQAWALDYEEQFQQIWNSSTP